MNGSGQLCVGLELQLFLVEVVIGLGLLKVACRFCPMSTNVDRKIASRETQRVSVGQGLASRKIIQRAKPAAWTYMNGMDPANAVMASAIRNWTSAARCACCAVTTG